MRKGLFINYRRDDAEAYAGWLYEVLANNFGKDQIFRDVDSIEAGIDFEQEIEDRVANSRVMITIIGPNWIGSKDENCSTRLDNPCDWVRREIEVALDCGVRIIPVLVGEARLPAKEELPLSLKQLATKQAVRVSHENFRRDAETLLTELKPVVSERSFDFKNNVVGLVRWALYLIVSAFLFYICLLFGVQIFEPLGVRKSFEMGSVAAVLFSIVSTSLVICSSKIILKWLINKQFMSQ